MPPMHKTTVLLLTFLLALAQPLHAEDRPVNSRLADMVEQVVAKTKFSVNIRDMDDYSININKINGRSVCAPEAAEDVKVLQAAFNEHPNIYRNYSIYLISITGRDGIRKVSNFATIKEKIKEKGVLKGDCISLYVSVHPDADPSSR